MNLFLVVQSSSKVSWSNSRSFDLVGGRPGVWGVCLRYLWSNTIIQTVCSNEPQPSANICIDPVWSGRSAPGQTASSAEFLSASLWSSPASEVFSQSRSGCSVWSGSLPRLCSAHKQQVCSPQRVYCKSFHIPLRLSGGGLRPWKTKPSRYKPPGELPALKQILLSLVSLRD